MSTGPGEADERISGTKIEPLESPIKYGVPCDTSEHGVIGTDENINECRINPLGGHGQYQHPLPHANSQGVVGRDDVIAGAKIEPLASHKMAGVPDQGLDDESVDAARIAPMGEVREEMP